MRQERSGSKTHIKMQQQQPPPALFLCPISLEIMRDPVIVCTGQTYDRPSIEKWIKDGHRSCPITMLQLHDLTLIPNIIVRQLIEAWCSSEESASSMFINLQHHINKSEDLLPSNPQDHSQLQESELAEQVLCLLRRIAKGQDVKQSVVRLKSMVKDEVCGYIIEAGGALLMASMLADELMQRGTVLLHHDDSPCEEIMSLLAILCRNSSREVIGAVFSESGALECIVAHLEVASTAARISAAMLLKRLLVSDEIRVALGKSTQFFRGLLDLLDGSNPGKKSLVKVLHRACSLKPNRSRAVEEGVIETLISILSSTPSSSDLETGERALATLELLCTVEQGRRAVYEHTAAVHCTVRMLVGYSRQSTEHATGCLLLVCQSGPVEVLQVAIRAGARRQLLLLLQSDCTARAKKKALELLKLFHAIFFVQGDEQVSSDFKNVDLY